MSTLLQVADQPARGEPGYVALFDVHAFRRRAVALMLQDWLDQHGLMLIELDETAWSQDLMLGELPYRIAIFAIGGAPLAGPMLSLFDEFGQRLEHVPRVLLADDDSFANLVAAFKQGVRAFIPTRSEPDEAKRVLSFVLNGGSYFPPTWIFELASTPDRHDNGGCEEAARGQPPLTGRQLEVLQCIRQGKSNKVIARDLLLRESTVKVHVRQILRRLGAENRTQAALRAAQLGPSTLNGELHGADERDAVWG